MKLHGWGRYPQFTGELIGLGSVREAAELMRGGRGLIARGNGRSYGDAAVGDDLTLSTRGLDAVGAFDPASGRLTAQAGVLLADILRQFVPQGFFPPVVPGTRLVTVGGMIASDVHGKNAHLDGSFGRHLESLSLVLPGGETVRCSREENPRLFAATVGGMGLTGVIVEATFTMRRLETGWIRQRVIACADIAETLDALDATRGDTYSVAWVDGTARGASLGRALVFSGEHTTAEEAASAGLGPELDPPSRRAWLALPFDLPAFALNRVTVGAFNRAFFRRGASRQGRALHVPLIPYMFPLDRFGGWNRIYGRRGLLQHQSVFPEGARAAVAEVLERFVTRAPSTSFTVVLKRLGRGEGMLSFPMAGYTLAIDLHAHDGVLALMDEVDRVVVKAQGRLYLAKDARQSRETFEAGYPRLAEFKALRREIGAAGRIESRLSRRLGL
jgi:FAD/FMN-containing dehydrogenase